VARDAVSFAGRFPRLVLVVTAPIAFTAIGGGIVCALRRRSSSVVAGVRMYGATFGLGVLVPAA